MVGGSGGAGATTFACALAQMAARTGPAVVVDADPLGPGADRVLGLETRDGVRWDALCRTTGRLSARALREALPRRDGLGVLTWYAGGTPGLEASRSARPSPPRSAATTWWWSTSRAAATRWSRSWSPAASGCWCVVVPSVAGVAAAGRLCARFADPARLRLVVRGSGIDPEEVARATGVGVLASMADQRGLAEAIDLGLGPVRSRRGPLGRTATEVLARLTMTRAAA